MVAGRPSTAPLGPVYPAGSALGGGRGLLWPYGTCVVGWCLHAVVRNRPLAAHIAFLGSFSCPWGIASHPIPEIGTFAFLTILPPQGGPNNGMAFFPPDAA